MSTSGPAPVSRTFDARVAELGFTLPVPPDWISHELPAEEPDFGNPTLMVPLAVVTAPHSALVFAIAARPAYEDGSLHDWARYLLQNHGLTPRTLGVHAVGTLPAIVGEAVQASDMGPMLVRFAFCEDGRRLLNLTLTAPEMLAGTVQGLWFEILSQFVLTTPRGPTVPVMAGTSVGNVEAPESPAAAVAAAEAAALVEEARAAAARAAVEIGQVPVESPITSTPARVDASTNLAEQILRSARYGIPSEQEEEELPLPGTDDVSDVPVPSIPTPEAPPAWLVRAQQLEQAGDVSGAERLIKDSVPNAWYAVVIADMHRDRMLRFRAVGDLVAARAARKAAVDWIGAFTVFATSGGEGAAFSYERDQFLARLPEV